MDSYDPKLTSQLVTKLIPVSQFSLFGITVSEAQKIARSFNTLVDHVCMITLIEE